jgi:hypothetical protein
MNRRRLEVERGEKETNLQAENVCHSGDIDAIAAIFLRDPAHSVKGKAGNILRGPEGKFSKRVRRLKEKQSD